MIQFSSQKLHFWENAVQKTSFWNQLSQDQIFIGLQFLQIDRGLFKTYIQNHF